jgi:L-threonylcarbamoyladenylate synthase
MQTERLNGRQQADLQRAADLLAAGECVAVPTETVYGLAADARNASAVGAIFAAKGRPPNHPLIVHLADAGQMPDWAQQVPEEAWRLAKAFWPGPMTLLLAKAADVPGEVTGGLPSVGLRVPAHPVFQALLARLQTGLAAPSANLYKALSPTSAEQVLAGLDGRIAAVLDGGDCAFGLESTIIDLTRPQQGVRILRAGPISRSAVETVLGRAVELPQQHNEAVPGNVKAHYQPRTPLQLCSSAELEQRLAAGITQDTVLLLWSPALQQAAQGRAEFIRLPDNSTEFARLLYQTLYLADQRGYRQLLLEQVPDSEAWQAVNDRLSRAASV